MAYKLTSLVDPSRGFDTLIDVRSPEEFAEDHIPGAINLPVLSNEERAKVGTIYVQDSAFRARKVGAALVARNAAHHIEEALADHDGGWKPLVYCWRGGQRSGSFASILSQIGWRAEVVDGGYQSYRRMVARQLYDGSFPVPVVLLDGNTGTGKTAVLQLLADRGVQVIDLEGLANHRGSALGARGAQPSQKNFESKLAAIVASLDPNHAVVIEAESSKVGKLSIPSSVFSAMKSGHRIRIEASLAARAEFLTREYEDVISDSRALWDRLNRLRKLQGHEKVNHWQLLADTGDFRTLAEQLIRDHYDPRYRKVRARNLAQPEVKLEAGALDKANLEQIADRIAAIIRQGEVS